MGYKRFIPEKRTGWGGRRKRDMRRRNAPIVRVLVKCFASTIARS